MGRQNPVANDTESSCPRLRAKEVAKPKVTRAGARRDPSEEQDSSRSRRRPTRRRSGTGPGHGVQPEPGLQLSKRRQRSARCSPRQGAGTVGLDQNSVLGNRFGAYAALLMQRVAERWHTDGLEGAAGAVRHRVGGHLSQWLDSQPQADRRPAAIINSIRPRCGPLPKLRRCRRFPPNTSATWST